MKILLILLCLGLPVCQSYTPYQKDIGDKGISSADEIYSFLENEEKKRRGPHVILNMQTDVTGQTKFRQFRGQRRFNGRRLRPVPGTIYEGIIFDVRPIIQW